MEWTACTCRAVICYSDSINYLTFIFYFQHLKRTGWVLRNVNEPETVSGHMYRMAIMSFLFDDDDDVDRDR